MEFLLGIAASLVVAAVIALVRAMTGRARRPRLFAEIQTPAPSRGFPQPTFIVVVKNQGRSAATIIAVRIDIPSELGAHPYGDASEAMREVREGIEWTTFNVGGDLTKPLTPGPDWEIETFTLTTPIEGRWDLPIKLWGDKGAALDATIPLHLGPPES